MIEIKEHKDGVTIECYVTPKAGRSRIKGERNGALAVALAAPPVEGRANEALIEFMAHILGIPKSHISILRGETGRTKLIFIKGLSKEKVRGVIGAVSLE